MEIQPLTIYILTLHFVFLTSSNLDKTSKELSRTLKTFVKELTSYETFRKEVKTLYDSNDIIVKTLNVSEVSKEFNDNLRNLLVSRINSVKAIKKKAESLYNNYTYNENIQPFDYRNDKKLPNTSVRYEPTFSIGNKVNLNQSHVQFPTNIYEYDKKILNDAKWSEGLDSVFLKNLEKEPSLLWQYVGTNNGIFRSFPGSRQEDVVLDKYDCRRRLWYSQAINSPKDVLIALDQSGSMTGINFNIAKLTVKSLIDTLQQDDFFNVITFGAETNFIIPCLSNLTQATTRNKDLIKTAVDNLPFPNGESDIKLTLNNALNILKKDSNNNLISSSCTKILLLVSDGVEEDDTIHELLHELNQEEEVSLFAFQIGPNKNKGEMRRLACRHGGEYYEFPTVGNVWNRVLKYQQVLSYPIAKAKQDMVVFTPLYLDSSGLGMMTTIAVGIFSNATNVTSNTLVGVAGVDIGTTLVERQPPYQKLGIFGHAFSINNNGLFLMHPRFRDQNGHLPDPATVYLSELEHTTDPSKSIKLMKEMIDDKTGCMDAELDWLYMDDIKRSVRFNATYCYRPANGTPFSTGVSVPFINQKFLTVKMVNLKSNLQNNRYLSNDLDNHESIQIANWLFCDIPAKAQETNPASLKLYPTAEELKSFILDSSESIDDKCDEDVLWKLLLFSKVTTNFTHTYWDNTKLEEQAVKAVYIITSSGFTQSHFFNYQLNLNRDILKEIRYAHPASFYMRGLDNILVFTVHIRNKRLKTQNTNTEISVGVPITVSSDRVLVGIIGMVLPSQYLQNLLLNVSKEFTCDHPACVAYSCNDLDNLKCYLLDEHGYVVASNKGEIEVGYFFGYVNGMLMRELEVLGIYKSEVYRDNQAQCQDEKYVESSAISFRSFLHKLITSFAFLITDFLSILTILLSNNVEYTLSSESNINVSCTKQFDIHSVSNHSINHNGYINCTKHCKQKYIIETVEGTNLVLVITDDQCNSTCLKYTHGFEPTKIEETETCNKNLHYRKALPLCYKLTAGDFQCASRIGTLKPQKELIFGNIFLFLCFYICVFSENLK
ncbi:voltage-dependent calcium channel subunit alpha-2/delta-3-like [Hydractinia symbiolongicarpus]|uniref:voltage-dependent calcium channel subunit alpha-2/delta-3-like n=1 Tax=Hydractinia symbiolongicarpus TaxID=13093 RepID=UPI00254CD430|nr:voltage-dependent calcium channel subunit alpha-2/delta-3-like [Hydractinia symbiolongicarpus]